MDNLPFVFWMLLWPLVYDIGKYIDAKREEIQGEPIETTPTVRGVVALVTGIIWFAVGALLYRGTA